MGRGGSPTVGGLQAGEDGQPHRLPGLRNGKMTVSPEGRREARLWYRCAKHKCGIHSRPSTFSFLQQMPTMLSLVIFVTMATRSWADCSMSGWSSSASAAVASPQTSAKGSIATSGYNDFGSATYPDDQECFLAIVPTGVATSFKLSFSSFTTEKDSDFLYIYDGTSTSSTILLTASGSSLDEIPGQAVQSSGTTMLLKFVSTEPFTQGPTRRGIYAFYVTDGTVSSRVL